MDKNGFEIKSAEYLSQEYEGLRALWCEVFGDTPAYVDAFYKNFEDDITGYAVIEPGDEGTINDYISRADKYMYAEKEKYHKFIDSQKKD